MKKIYNSNWLFKLKMLAVFGALLIAGSASAQLSGAYTIDSTSAASATNFLSFEDFADSLNANGVSAAGITVNVVALSGPYVNQNMAIAVSGTSTGPIVINGNGETISGSGSVVELNGADYVTISGLTIENSGTSSGERCVWMHNGADNNTVSGCDLMFSGYTGTSNSTAYVSISGDATSHSSSNGPHGSNNTIDANTMYSSTGAEGPYYGVDVYGNTGTRESNNIVTDNDISGVYYYNIYVYGSNDAEITGNTIHDNRTGAGTMYGVYLGYSDVVSGNVMIEDNIMEDLTLSGTFYTTYFTNVDGTSTTPFTLSNNTVDNLTVGTIVGFRNSSCIYGEVDGNVISNSATSGTYGLQYGFYNTSCDYITTSNNQVKDNTFDGSYGIYYGLYNSSSDYCEFSGNTFTGNETDGSYGFYYGFYNSNSDYSEFNNNEVTNNLFDGSSYGAYYGFRMNNCDNSDWTGNVFSDNEVKGGSYGLYYMVYNVNNASSFIGTEIERNEISASNYNWFYLFYSQNSGDIIGSEINENTGSGNYMYYTFYHYQSGDLIDNNINYNTSGNYFYYTFYLYYHTGEVSGNSFSYNSSSYMYYIFYDFYGDGELYDGNIITGNSTGYLGYIFMIYYNSGDSRWINNMVVENDMTGGLPYAFYFYQNSSVSGIEFSHNTIAQEGSIAYYYGAYIYCGTATNCKFQNNIIYFDVSTTGTNYPVYGQSGTGDWEFSNNVYFAPTASTWWYNGTGYANYAAFAAASDQTDNSYYTDPDFVNYSGGDLTPQNPLIANKGVPGVTPLDFAGTTRTDCGPDIGALEFFVDHSASNLDFTSSATECAGFEAGVSFDLTNGASVSLSGLPVFWSISDGKIENESSGTIASGATGTHTFATNPVFNGGGLQTLTVGLGCDDDESNNELTASLTITPGPSGSDLTQGTTWEGYWRNGDMANPDVIVPNYNIEYEVQTPATGGTFGTDWGVTSNMAVVGGSAVGAAEGFVINGNIIEIDPDASLEGKTVYVSVVVTDLNTGCDSTIGRYLYIPNTPVASFEAEDVCLDDLSTFKNTTTLAGPDYLTTHWEFNDPDASITDDNSDIADGYYVYSTYGSGIAVEMTVRNGVYPLFEYTVTNTINITPKPQVDFKVLNACEGTPIQFNNNSDLPAGTPGTIAYVWDFGGEGSSTADNPTYTFSTPGQRVVTLVASANGCNASISKNAYQFEMPTASFIPPTSACNYEEVGFTNTSIIANDANMGFAWDFNDGGISRLENPSHPFATPGSKTVELTATSEFGCESVSTKTFVLEESPEADFTWDAACNLTPINFTFTGSAPNNGAQSSFVWDYNGEKTETNPSSPMYLFSQVGTKEVTLTVADVNGCTNTITKEINVVLQAKAAFTVKDVCEGDEAIFTNSSTVAAGDLEYVWEFGDAGQNTSTNLNPRFEYPVTGNTRIVNVTLNALVPGGCPDVLTKSLTINAAPDATFTADRQGRHVEFAGPSGMTIYQWRFGDGAKSTEQNPSYTYTNVDKGSYEVCLTTKNTICWSEDECQTVVIDLLGVDKLAQDNEMITVYPNPNAGSFNLEISNASDNVVIKVGDILGNEVPVELVDMFNGKYSVNMSAIADGVYFVQVKNGDYYATKRITVSK